MREADRYAALVNGTATRRAGRRNRYAAGRRNRYAVSGLSQCSRYAANDYLGRSGNKGQVMQIGSQAGPLEI